MGTRNIPEDRKDSPGLSPFFSLPGAMVNLLWLELPISGANFHGTKGVRHIEIQV